MLLQLSGGTFLSGCTHVAPCPRSNKSPIMIHTNGFNSFSVMNNILKVLHLTVTAKKKSQIAISSLHLLTYHSMFNTKGPNSYMHTLECHNGMNHVSDLLLSF